MAGKEVSQTCGTKKITYPAGSSFVCVCPANGKCTWVVVLSDGTVFTGTELVAPPKPKPPHVKVEGSLQAIAVGLQRVTKRRVIVPPKRRKEEVKARTMRGTPAFACEALGIELTKKRV